MKGELLIQGGTLVTDSESTRADLLVRDGKIAAIRSQLPNTTTIIDARGKLVMPGGIDSHVHLQHPIDRLSIETADDFHTGTVAAACGGVTSIVDFALQRHGETLREAVSRRLKDANGKPVIDYGFHIIVTDVRDDVLEEIPALIEEGFPSYKIYMTYADKVVRDDALLRLLEVTAANDGLAYLHCENDCAVNHLIHGFISSGKTGPQFHPQSRPPLVEGEATHRALVLGELAGAPLCIAHVTSSDALRHVQKARARGLPVVCETCPQYLVLTDNEYNPTRGFEAAKFVCSPPLRGAEHHEVLWEGLADGSIQQVASDHAPFRFAGQKEQGRGDFTRIPNGLPGIETRLPLIYTEGVKTGRLTQEEFVALVSTQPARIFGMYPKKGSLQVGADADLILIDPQRVIQIAHEKLHSNIDYSPFSGMRLYGMPTLTLSRGEVINRDGVPDATAGRGEFIARHACDRTELP
ncbi:MAG: dihydropyrimidinase [Acidobacteria bacterium]|jgi:dihydropyrimidinase|nr:dihydropyrimidinase [Acidobacteriota bacterium]MEE3151958.1 dihydropyrimidinase [Acidobacteriota bacterium]|tara:strand:+ start:1085 stop:2485 length:1401 start_codon:yes stop_codon:yes gene_type:complete